ncbi:hypothetical protein APHAL10511_005336 [Amanita phalloides]|nr:hypothetical protein APHAL10511_005336 [Amanita phalloides]
MFKKLVSLSLLLVNGHVERNTNNSQHVCQTIASKISSTSSVYYPGGKVYDSDIFHWVSSSTQQSACSVEPGSARDVGRILQILGANRTPFGVKSGGHMANPGFSSTPGVEIALSQLNQIKYDPTTRTVEFGPGVVFDDVYTALEPYNMSVVGARVSGVGVGGFLLGGGYSWKTNAYGLGVDNIIAYELAKPDGDVVRVTESSDPDLFFGLKGGFNNFGIVTCFTMRALPQPSIWVYIPFTQQNTNDSFSPKAGTIDYPASSVSDVTKAIIEFSANNNDPKANSAFSYSFVNGQAWILYYDCPSPPPGLFDDFLKIPASSNSVHKWFLTDFIKATNLNALTGFRGIFHTVPLLRHSPSVMAAILNETKLETCTILQEKLGPTPVGLIEHFSVPDASYDERISEHGLVTGCPLLEQLEKWIIDNSVPIFLLLGPAATGKSTVARGFVHTSAVQVHYPVISFCFNRDDSRRSDFYRVIPTLARQLRCMKHPGLKDTIDNLLEMDPLIWSRPLGKQYSELVIKPIHKSFAKGLSPSMLYIILLDGLDACRDHTIVKRFFSEIEPIISDGSCHSRIKILCISRSDPSILSAFRSVIDHCQYFFTRLDEGAGMFRYAIDKTEQQATKAHQDSMSTLHDAKQMAERNLGRRSRSCLPPILWVSVACSVACLAIVIHVLRTPYWSFGHARIASPLAGLPPAPEFFFGRDELMNRIIAFVKKKVRKGTHQRKHLALYGAIKSGKSTTARMFVNLEEVARMFGRSRHWIRCQSVANVDAMLHALAKSLSIETGTNSTLMDSIIEHLDGNRLTVLIILDDYERPESEDEVEKLKDALGRLGQCQSANVYILLTTRNLPLPEGVAWTHFLVEPLSLDATIVMFRSISGHTEDSDEEITELAKSLGCLPFSISIAARERQTGLRPSEFLTLLESGQDKRLGRIDDVVRISLSRPRFTSNPEALTFLCILARLPRGVRFDNLDAIAPLIDNVIDAWRTIQGSGHTRQDTDNFVVLETLTRSYIARHQDLDARHLYALRQHYFQICEDAGHELGSEKFKYASKVLALEEENAQAVLLDALQTEPSTDVLRAVVGYANFLYGDAPNIQVTAKALDVIKENPSLDADGVLLPQCLFSHGRLLHRLDKYHEAGEAFSKAEKVLNVTENRQLGRIYLMQGQVNRLVGNQTLALEFYTKAHEWFETAGNHAGVSESLQSIALMALKEGDTQRAIELLDHAKDKCDKLQPCVAFIGFYTGWVLRVTNSTYSASLLLSAGEAFEKYGTRYMTALCMYQRAIALSWSGQHDEAEKTFQRAYQVFDELKNLAQMGYTLDHLVDLELKRRNFKQALQYNGEARFIFETIENPIEVADCYISRGSVLARMRRFDDARDAYNNARITAMQQCNNNTNLMQIIDEDVKELNQMAASSWRWFLPW